MENGNRLGLWVLGSAILVGVVGDILLRGTPWGINFPLLVLVLLAVAFFPNFVGWTRFRPGLFVVPGVMFALALTWRASPFLAALNVLFALLCLSLAARKESAEHPGGLAKQVVDHLKTSAFAVAGPAPISVGEIRWRDVAPGGWGNPALAALRGVLIALPLVLVFGALLVAADAVFEEIVTGVFDFDAELVFGHIFLIAALAWIVCGFLYLTLFKKDWPDIVRYSGDRPRWISLGAVETGIVLGSINLLFLSFVIVQAGYLFGGTVGDSMNFSEYARRGFFELCAVVALVVPLLLLLDWLYRSEEAHAKWLINALMVATIGLVAVILASALWRMSLYFREFGLTELRLYTSAFMVWLGIVLVVFLFTVPWRRRSLFGSATFYAALVMAIMLNLINPDATIARVNIERFEAGKRFDAAYLTRLSEDAAPVIFAELDLIGDELLYEDLSIRSEDVITIEETVTERWRNSENDDWRSWNLSRTIAKNIATPP